jgi:hypothetical protein
MADVKHREQTGRRDTAPHDLPAPHHVADQPVADPDAPDAAVRSPIAGTGLPVAEQVREEWNPSRDGGLPTPLPGAGRASERNDRP